MKKFNGVMILSIIMLFSFSAFAQNSPPSPLDVAVITWLQGLPYVGTVLAMIAKWSGLIAGVFTSLTVAAISILTLPEMLARWAGAQSLADKIAAFSSEVLPWFKYLSMFDSKRPALVAKVKDQEKQISDLWYHVNKLKTGNSAELKKD